MFIQVKVQNMKQVAFKNPSESIKADEGTFTAAMAAAAAVAALPKVSALIPPRSVGASRSPKCSHVWRAPLTLRVT